MKLRWTWILIASIILIIVLFIFNWFTGKKGTFTDIRKELWPEEAFYYRGMNSEETNKFESKGEAMCRACLESIYNLPFKNTRLSDIKNSNTSRDLEIDCYNEQLKLGVEYHGINHYKFIPFFHKTMENFLEMKERDHYKENMCKKLGITLIIVPYNTKLENICKFLKSELKKRKLYDEWKVKI